MEVLRGRIENLSISVDSEGGKQIEEVCFVKDCEGPDPLSKLHSALTAPGMPQEGDPCSIGNVFLDKRTAKAWGDNDAVVTLSWKSKPRSIPGGGSGPGSVIPRRTEVGVTLRQVETDFDAESRRQTELAKRIPITVGYAAEGATVGTTQSVTVPCLVPSPTLIYETIERKNPAAEAIKYVGATNSKAWKGVAANVALCMSITGVSDDGEKTWRVRREFAFDPFDKWKQTARYRDPITQRLVALTAADVAAGNGIKLIEVQDSLDFSKIKI